MADWNAPTNASTYTSVLTTLNEKIANAAKMDFAGDTNVPTGTVRHDAATNKFQEWNGSSWADLTVHFGASVGIGTTSPGVRLEVQLDADAQTAVRVRNGSAGSSATAVVQFGNDENAAAAGITLYGTGNTSGGNAGGLSIIVGTTKALAFGVAGAEKARFDTSGRFLLAKTAVASGNPGVHFDTTAAHAPMSINKTATGTVNAVLCSYSGTYVGGIDFSNTATSFPTSSDYRLKENLVPLAGAVDRLLRLKVYRGNFIADPDQTLDMFLAHEVQEVVPNAVHGEKDGERAQALDHSKLVPLLTAALIEAVGRIAALEAR
jgi:hypothetical protein